ncbi:U1 small nuclear ribonucleoprotein, putative [Plasmodium malariae]|uniref:U1 small nuclear ribonucleoprotein, putative n=1 Tax=Plasmodium malariae TaxID=5858 RepID=A0A1C3KZ06_PLAMA|nr:U1 small nuclear ribonucleoprotein, putative [Plasmodium malariae]
MSAIGMPAHILILFQARPLLNFYKPVKKKKPKEYSGVANYLNYFEDKEPPPKIKLENTKERRERKKKEKITYNELMLKEKRKEYDPFKYEDLTSDPKKTLFIGRLSYEVNEKKLKKEFENYGKIRKVKIIYDKNFKPRGYAFIEFEHTKSLNDAYKLADGKKIDNRRILVDIERARTVKNWIPRRLGGGKGPARGSDDRKKVSHNINWSVLINKDKYRNDKKKGEDMYKNVPLYNERNDDDDGGDGDDDGGGDNNSNVNSALKNPKHRKEDDRRSSKRDHRHRSRRSDSHDRHRHKHRKRDRSSKERDRHRDRDRDRDRDEEGNRGREYEAYVDDAGERYNSIEYNEENEGYMERGNNTYGMNGVQNNYAYNDDYE